MPFDADTPAAQSPPPARRVVLQAPFGCGHAFLDAWRAHRAQPGGAAPLSVIALDAEPPSAAALIEAHRGTPHEAMARTLAAAWPPLTPDLHRLAFDGGAVELLLLVAELRHGLPMLAATVDRFEVGVRERDLGRPDGTGTGDGPSARRGDTGEAMIVKRLARLASTGATLALDAPSPEAASHFHAQAISAGFVGAAPDGERIRLTFAPHWATRRAAAAVRPAAGAAERHAVVVGAGLAGCAVAWALAERGWRTTLIDRHAAVACAASGNPAGLFHGIVTASDGAHARFNRVAAIAAAAAVRTAIAEHGVAGSAAGLLRGERTLDLAAMRARLDGLRLPGDFVRAVSADEAAALSGLPSRSPMWFYPSGGWVDPAGLARAFVSRGGARVQLLTGVDVGRLQRLASARWRIDDTTGRPVASAATVVLANASEAFGLLAPWRVGIDWPIDRVRGQISWLAATTPGLTAPRLPIAGGGYVLPAIDGRVLFGATAQRDDADPSVRASDHGHNLARLAQLLGSGLEIDVGRVDGRTGWRCASRDSMPLVGAVPDEAPAGVGFDVGGDTTGCAGLGAVAGAARNAGNAGHAAGRTDFPRFGGLYLCTAMGSRGIGWSALAAQVLAAQIGGEPPALPIGLLDAIDPARFEVRRSRGRPAG